jgi:sortase (surface protein transpeptidase)
MMSRAEKIAKNKVAKRIEAAFYATCQGVQIPIMMIPKIFREGEALIRAGASEEELKAGLAEYVQMIKLVS